MELHLQADAVPGSLCRQCPGRTPGAQVVADGGNPVTLHTKDTQVGVLKWVQGRVLCTGCCLAVWLEPWHARARVSGFLHIEDSLVSCWEPKWA